MMMKLGGVIVLAMAPVWAQTIEPLGEFGPSIGGPALSPDGKVLAYSVEGEIRVRAIEGGPETVFAKQDEERGGFAGGAVWSPDGTRIAFTYGYCEHCDDRLIVKTFPNGAQVDLGGSCQTTPSWTPDSKFLIVAAPRGDEECRIDLVPVDGSARTTLMAEEGGELAVSPDGKRLVYATKNQLKLATLSTDFRISGTPAVLAQEPHAISAVHWLPDGHGVVYQVWNGGYTRRLTIDGQRTSRLVDPGTNFSISQILPDGRALGIEDGGRRALWRVDLHGPALNAERIRTLPWTDAKLAVSPDGASIAFETNRNGPSEIWVSNFDGTQSRTLVASIPPFDEDGDNTHVDGISWSPDGRWIAIRTEPGIGHGDSDARLYLVASSGGALRELVHECSMMNAAPPWSGDSRFIFIVRTDGDFKDTYFRVDIASGGLTQVRESELPPNPRKLIGAGASADQPHVVQSGRFLYYVDRGEYRTRPVMIRDLLR